TGHAKAGCGTVQLEDTGAARAGDHVGGEPRPVIHVDNLDFLIGKEVGRVEQVLVHRQRTLIVEIGRGDRGTMDLRLHQVAPHRFQGSPSITLSMSRVFPTRAAIATIVPGAATSTGSMRSGSTTAI